MVFWKKKKISLGGQDVSELTILEWKRLFSIKLFHFHKTTGSQDRFHTHAFKAVSFLLHGDYTEEIIEKNTIMPLLRSRKRILYIPADQFHRITRSTGCHTLLITGPWGEEFSELRKTEQGTYQEVVCGAGRKDIKLGARREINAKD